MTLNLVVGRRTAALRRWLAPRPWLRWLVLIACATVFVVAVADHRADLSAARADWGDTRRVWVAARRSEAGEPIAASEADLPVAVLPDDPVGDDPTGTPARHTVTAGEIVVVTDVAADGTPAGLVPAGWVAVPVAESTTAHARIGERVIVTSDGMIVADDALVVDVVDGTTLVAVPAEVGPLVALANEGGVTLLRAP